MPSHYEQLAISPYASSQEIETALAQQHQLGDIPALVLALIATTLLSEQQRQAYDQQLMALDEVQSPAQTPAPMQLQHAPSEPHIDTDDGIVFYDGLHAASQTQLHKTTRYEHLTNDVLSVDTLGTVFDVVSDGL